jgi:hypothetical protein
MILSAATIPPGPLCEHAPAGVGKLNSFLRRSYLDEMVICSVLAPVVNCPEKILLQMEADLHHFCLNFVPF